MVFSDTSNNSGLVQDITFLTGADTNAYAVSERTRNINRWYYKAVIEAWKHSYDWEFDDANQTGFPVATANFVNSQEDYQIPTNALKILRVEVLNNSGIWNLLEPIDETQVAVALTEFQKIDGLPRYYRVTRRNIVLYPAPDNGVSVTLSGGLRVYFLREVDEFTATDTTQEPGIVEPFHRILSIGASLDWVIAKAPEKTKILKTMVDELLEDLKGFYSSRHRNFKVIMRPKRYLYI